MSRKGNCYDNACMEALFSILKKELVHFRTFQTEEQYYEEIHRYIELFYNRKRIYGSIGYQTPVQFAESFVAKLGKWVSPFLTEVQ